MCLKVEPPLYPLDLVAPSLPDPKTCQSFHLLASMAAPEPSTFEVIF